ncbi:MAG: hypothetical protein WC044_00305 [Crocinitomicaceae bacterium]
MKIILLSLSLFIGFTSFTQTVLGSLSNKLKEISGLVFVNDTLLVGHNDGGNAAEIFFLDLSGKIIREVKIKNAKNKDWEDIAFDGKDRLFIGDIGNNNNDRTDLCIYEISLKEALRSDSVNAKKFEFSYSNQHSFPPPPEDKHFDAEALCFFKDSLYIFTKCRTEPWDGNSYVFSLATNKNEQKAAFSNSLYVGKSGWWQDAITGVDIQGSYCYLLTYNRLMVYKIVKDELFFDHRIYLKPITQKESIAVNSKGQMVVADEKQTALGGGYLYEVPAYVPVKKTKAKHKKP